MEKYKVDYRVFTREPLLSSSVDYVFSAVRFFDGVVKFANEIFDFDPSKREELVDDVVEKFPKLAGKTFWVQQNCYLLEGENTVTPRYRRISFTAYLVEHFPSE